MPREITIGQASVTNYERECVRCSRDKHIPNMYSCANNMNPGSVSPELMVCGHFHSITDYIFSLVASHQHCTVLSSTIQVLVILVLQGLTQVEEMLVSAVMPIMSIYRLPHG